MIESALVEFVIPKTHMESKGFPRAWAEKPLGTYYCRSDKFRPSLPKHSDSHDDKSSDTFYLPGRHLNSKP